MGDDYDKREHSTKKEVDDLTNYQKLNSQDGAGVMTRPEEIPKLNESGEDDAASITPTQRSNTDEIAEYDEGEFNDGAAFNTVDDEGKTNT